MIAVTVNGRREELPERMSVTAYLERRHIDLRLFAVAHNGEVVPKAELPATVLDESDRLEIVRMVGGG